MPWLNSVLCCLCEHWDSVGCLCLSLCLFFFCLLQNNSLKQMAHLWDTACLTSVLSNNSLLPSGFQSIPLYVKHSPWAHEKQNKTPPKKSWQCIKSILSKSRTLNARLKDLWRWCHRLCMRWWLTHCVDVEQRSEWHLRNVPAFVSVKLHRLEYIILRGLERMTSWLCWNADTKCATHVRDKAPARLKTALITRGSVCLLTSAPACLSGVFWPLFSGDSLPPTSDLHVETLSMPGAHFDIQVWVFIPASSQWAISFLTTHYCMVKHRGLTPHKLPNADARKPTVTN